MNRLLFRYCTKALLFLRYKLCSFFQHQIQRSTVPFGHEGKVIDSCKKATQLIFNSCLTFNAHTHTHVYIQLYIFLFVFDFDSSRSYSLANLDEVNGWRHGGSRRRDDICGYGPVEVGEKTWKERKRQGKKKGGRNMRI